MDGPHYDGEGRDGPGYDRPRKVTKREWMRRIGWLVALWLGGVFTLATVAYVIRVFMQSLGMR